MSTFLAIYILSLRGNDRALTICAISKSGPSETIVMEEVHPARSPDIPRARAAAMCTLPDANLSSF